MGLSVKIGQGCPLPRDHIRHSVRTQRKFTTTSAVHHHPQRSHLHITNKGVELVPENVMSTEEPAVAISLHA
ncbi:hypothetical protein SKAU_G00313640 [Synaphobranchus kaupii]|uniref:Uncharacterized protein n=1 Tax=Synaphobranchus kaupii TaxID=118154 RepID=A0A9Q1ILL2_SYNKA|nr:hypothetical protein SKAU_G00313640 [Synaphobranchus kaupii]